MILDVEIRQLVIIGLQPTVRDTPFPIEGLQPRIGEVERAQFAGAVAFRLIPA